MKKKLLKVLACIMLCAGFVLPNAGVTALSNVVEVEDIKIVFNGKEVSLASPVLSVNNMTMYPLRECLELMGATVTWDGKTKTSKAAFLGKTVEFTVDSGTYMVSGQSMQMENGLTAFNYKGKSYIPIRYAAEALGYKVEWNAQARTISVTSSEMGVVKKPEDIASNKGSWILTDGISIPGLDEPLYLMQSREKIEEIAGSPTECVHTNNVNMSNKSAYEYKDKKLHIEYSSSGKNGMAINIVSYIPGTAALGFAKDDEFPLEGTVDLTKLPSQFKYNYDPKFFYKALYGLHTSDIDSPSRQSWEAPRYVSFLVEFLPDSTGKKINAIRFAAIY